MFENINKFFKKLFKNENKESNSGKEAKERLHLVLMQDRANVSADFLDMMKQEIIEVIKKYIDVDENAIDVRLTNQTNEDGTNGAPALYANIPIINIKEENNNNETKSDDVGVDVPVDLDDTENEPESDDVEAVLDQPEDEDESESNDDAEVDTNSDLEENDDEPESND